MRPAMRVFRAILGIRFGIALFGLGTLVVVAAVGGVFGDTDQTGTTTQADVSAPKVMVHADHPTFSRPRCAWKAGRSLRICHSPSADLTYGPEVGP